VAADRSEISARYYQKHKDKCVAANKKWRLENLEAQRLINARAYQKSKPSQMKSRYGLSADQYSALMAVPCGICGGKATDVDHDHNTGRVRGGLCGHCNRGLGSFADNPVLLRMAADYLVKSGG
jgi:hypothetical protein